MLGITTGCTLPGLLNVRSGCLLEPVFEEKEVVEVEASAAVDRGKEKDMWKACLLFEAFEAMTTYQ
jgi:hypothetical protein